MPRGQRKSPKPSTATYESPESAEIARMTREGSKFAKRVGNELVEYAAEAATRMTTAAAQFQDVDNALADKPSQEPDPELAERVKLDPFAADKAKLDLAVATLQFESTRHAAALILQTTEAES